MRECDKRFGEFTWCHNGIEKVITYVKSKRNYVKHYNMICEKCSNLEDIFPDGLQVTWSNFKNGTFPCLCSKACKLEDDQLIKYLNKKTPERYQILSTNGLKGAKKMVSVYCKDCAEDWELFPSATFDIKVSHLKDGTTPCGCSKSYRYSDYEMEVLSERACRAKGFKLKSIKGGKLKVENPVTGYVWDVPFSYLSSSDKHLNDPSLSSEKRSKALEGKDSLHISEFFDKGNYHKDSQFTRTNTRTSGINASKYWEVTCGECKEVYHKTLSNLKRGQKGCSCQPSGGFNPSKPAYFYIVRWYGYGESYIKFGITNRKVMERISEQAREAKLDYEILHTFHHPSGQRVWDCERTIKQAMQTSVCPKEWLPDDYTETVFDTNDNLDILLNHIDEYLKEK